MSSVSTMLGLPMRPLRHRRHGRAGRADRRARRGDGGRRAGAAADRRGHLQRPPRHARTATCPPASSTSTASRRCGSPAPGATPTTTTAWAPALPDQRAARAEAPVGRRRPLPAIAAADRGVDHHEHPAGPAAGAAGRWPTSTGRALRSVSFDPDLPDPRPTAGGSTPADPDIPFMRRVVRAALAPPVVPAPAPPPVVPAPSPSPSAAARAPTSAPTAVPAPVTVPSTCGAAA